MTSRSGSLLSLRASAGRFSAGNIDFLPSQVLLVLFRRGHSSGEGLRVRVRDGVPGTSGWRVPQQAGVRPRRHLQEEGARPRV